MSTPALDLTGFPEELLEGILSHCLIASLSQPPRPSWHRIGPTPPSSHPVRGRLAVLLVCKKFLRISTPLFYHTVHILSSSQLHRLLSGALRQNPQLASHIRRAVFYGIWAEGGELLRMSGGSLRMLDITLDSTQLAPGIAGEIRDLDAEEFCEGLRGLTSLTHIMLRKPNDVYITRPKPRYVLSEIANAMRNWDELEYADIAFRVSDDSGTTVNHSVPTKVATTAGPVQPGPITVLTQALSTRRRLHTFSTILPSIWNESILRVSANLSLERIILSDGTNRGSNCRYTPFVSFGSPIAQTQTQWSAKDFYAAPVSASLPAASTPYFELANQGIMGTGLFMLQAKKYARLSELIRAGTYIPRTRAQTLDTQGPGPMSFASSSLAHQWSGQLSPTHAPTSHCQTSSYSQRYEQHHPSRPYHHQPCPHDSNQSHDHVLPSSSRDELDKVTYLPGPSGLLASTIQRSQPQSFSKRRMTGA